MTTPHKHMIVVECSHIIEKKDGVIERHLDEIAMDTHTSRKRVRSKKKVVFLLKEKHACSTAIRTCYYFDVWWALSRERNTRVRSYRYIL